MPSVRLNLPSEPGHEQHEMDTIKSAAGLGHWTVVGTGDFNADSMPDILRRNIASGTNLVWYENEKTLLGHDHLPAVRHPNSKIVGHLVRIGIGCPCSPRPYTLHHAPPWFRVGWVKGFLRYRQEEYMKGALRGSTYSLRPDKTQVSQALKEV